MKLYQAKEQRARNEVAAEYDRWYVENKGSLFDARERELFRKYTRGSAGKCVLDVGCGTGRIAEVLSADGAVVVGCDFSMMSLEVLRKRRPDVRALDADASAGLPLAARSVALVTACQVLQHLQTRELELALAECHRVLRPAGRLILAGYNGAYWRFRSEPEHVHENGLYARRLRPTELVQLARQSGFRVAHVARYRTLPLERLKSQYWNVLDRALGRIPMIGPLVSAYSVAVLVRVEEHA